MDCENLIAMNHNIQCCVLRVGEKLNFIVKLRSVVMLVLPECENQINAPISVFVLDGFPSSSLS